MEANIVTLEKSEYDEHRVSFVVFVFILFLS